MILVRNANRIVIDFNSDENETLDFVFQMSPGLFEEHIKTFLANRKRQQEENLKEELVKGMSRAQLKEELRKRNV